MMEITKVVSAAKKEIKNLALGQSEIERKEGREGKKGRGEEDKQ